MKPIPWHPMAWWNKRMMNLIERKTKGRWYGLEERIGKLPQPLYGILYLILYLVLEMPLFAICAHLDIVLHPLKHILLFVNITRCLLHKHNRKDLVPIHPKYNYYMCPHCYKNVVIYPNNNKFMLEDKDHSINRNIIRSEGKEAYWKDFTITLEHLEKDEY